MNEMYVERGYIEEGEEEEEECDVENNVTSGEGVICIKQTMSCELFYCSIYTQD